MLRRLGGCAIALALLLPTQATASPPAPHSSADQRAGAAVTTTLDVRLGHRPVRATTATKVRLTFEGRKGQLVNLARVDATEQCGGRTLRSGGKAVKPWAQGFWRLPRTGTYTAINKACRNREKQRVRLQVRRVVREDRLVPGAPVAAGANTRVTHLVPFRVGEQQRAYVRGPRLDLIRPDRSTTPDIDTEESSFLLRDYEGRERKDVPSPQGRYFVAIPAKSSVSLGVTTIRRASVDGAPVVVPEATEAGTFTQFVFTGEAGQWIYPEITSGPGEPPATQNWMAQVSDPFDDPVDYILPRVEVPCPTTGQASCSITQLPTSGTYVIDVLTGPSSGGLSVRLRSALRVPAPTVDGPAVTYSATSPGQWVVGDLPELPRDESGGSGVTMTVGNAPTSLTDWRVRAVSGYGPCNPGLFDECFNIFGAPNAFTLSPTTLSSPMPWDTFANQAVAVLAVPPGVTGSLDLTLTRPPAQ